MPESEKLKKSAIFNYEYLKFLFSAFLEVFDLFTPCFLVSLRLTIKKIEYEQTFHLLIDQAIFLKNMYD